MHRAALVHSELENHSMDGKINRGDQATEHAEKAYKMKCMSASYFHATIKVAFL